MAYKEGSEVKKGDLLFVVDQRPYLAALDSARAQLEGARASFAFAKQQNQRAQQLIKSNAISKEEAEQKRTAHDQSLAELHAAESAVATAALNLEFTEIRSPINGRTNRAQLTVGTTDALKGGETPRRLMAISAWEETPFFDARERAALLWTETLTLVAEKHAPDAIYEVVAAQFNEQELSELTFVIAAINAWNRFGIGFAMQPK